MAHASSEQNPNQVASQAYGIVQPYGSYLQILDEDDERRRRAGSDTFRSSHGTTGVQTEGDGHTNRPGDPAPHPTPHPSRRGRSQDRYGKERRRKRRRHHHRSPSSSSSSRSSDSDSDSDSKHDRPDSSLFPWSSQPTVRPELAPYSRRPWRHETITQKEGKSEDQSEVFSSTATFQTSLPPNGRRFSATITWICGKLSEEWSQQREILGRLPSSAGWRLDTERSLPRKQSPALAIGPLRLGCIARPSSMPSRIGVKNSSPIETISTKPSASSERHITQPSSSSSNVAVTCIREPMHAPYPTYPNSLPNTPNSQLESPRQPHPQRVSPSAHPWSRFAIVTTTLLALAALIATFASSASGQGIGLTIALKNLGLVNPVLNMENPGGVEATNGMGRSEMEIHGLAPRYLRGYVWTDGECSRNPSIEHSLHAELLPGPPDAAFANRDVADLINTNPQRFPIVTPINVDLFEYYLQSHPNRPFVDSVIRVTRDPEVLREARVHELMMGRFSEPFSKLQPGMKTSPLGLVPKPHSDKIDHDLVFGSRASPKIWCAFASLFGWIAFYQLGINPLQHYMDDFWSFWKSPHRAWYGDTLLPENQVQFLRLLDELGIPPKPENQQYGHRLMMIGFEVDPNAMTITLAEDKKRELVHRIREFVAKEDDPKTGKLKDRRPTLREWQQMLGEMNWALNVLPLARAGLNSSYQKISLKPKKGADGKPSPQKPRGPHTRILHIPGKDNIDADCIPRAYFLSVYQRWPMFRLIKIRPPRDALGGKRL